MIKRIRTSDIELVIEMLKDTESKMGSIDKISEFLSNETNYFIAYIENGKIVGYLLAYTLQRYDGRNEMMYLHEIDVQESFRKQGIASKLMDEIKGISKSKGYMKIFLITNKSNKAAVALYESSNGVANSDDDIIYEFK